MISPCIDTLRKLAMEVNGSLSSHQGSKHASPDLTRDIGILMKSLHERGVYKVELGRKLTGKKAMVPNTVTAGLNSLVGPLNDYNDLFLRLQARRRVPPLESVAEDTSESDTSSTSGTSSTSSTSSTSGHPQSIPSSPSPSRTPSIEILQSSSTDVPRENDGDSSEDSDSEDGGSIDDEAAGLFGDDWDGCLARETEEDIDLDM